MKDHDFSMIAEQIGNLCMSWSYLEHVTEATLWGILGIDDNLAPLVTWNKDMETRGKWIVEYGSAKHPEETDILKRFNADLKTVIQDRNIIVHGLVHRSSVRQPCWTIFRGVGKGKNFPISLDAPIIVRNNATKLADDLRHFNWRHGYDKTNTLEDQVEADWPKQLRE